MLLPLEVAQLFAVSGKPSVTDILETEALDHTAVI